MTDATRCYVSAFRLSVRSVTGVAAIVRGESCGNRQRHPASQRRTVARCATILWSGGAGQVLRMIEFQVEAFFEFVRESLQRRVTVTHIGVADRAHGNVRGGELRQVAAGAILVSGKARPGGIIGAMVTA